MTFGQPPTYAPQPVAPTIASNGFGLASLIVGVVALVLSVLPILSFVAWVPAIVAVVVGIVGLTRSSRPHGTSIAGTVLGGVALLLAIVLSIVYAVMFSATGRELREESVTVPAETTMSPAPSESAPQTSSEPETTPQQNTPIVFAGDGNGNTAPQPLEAGDYIVQWETRGDCYYSGDLVSDSGWEDQVFTADAVTSGVNSLYGVPSGSFHIEMITGPAPSCAWTVSITPAA